MIGINNTSKEWVESKFSMNFGGCNVPVIIFTQPLRSGRIWHMVNF